MRMTANSASGVINLNIALVTSGGISSQCRFTVAAYQLHIGDPVIVEFNSSINASDSIVAITELSVTEEESNPGLFRDISKSTQDAYARFLAIQWIIGITIKTRGFVIDKYGAETVVARTPSKMHPTFRVYDAPGK